MTEKPETEPEAQELHVELLVIGWGKGGKTLARQAGRAGRSVALVEQSEQMVGGSCINIGCVPSKALLHDAGERRPQDDPVLAFRAAVARRDGLTARLRERNRELLEELDPVRIVMGRAVFTGPRRVEVDTADGTVRISAETVCINTGAVSALPDLPGAVLGGRVHDSTSIQHLDPLPERLVIVGAGAIALEFASLFGRFGTEVTVLNRDERILPAEDPEVAELVAASLSDAGVRTLSGAETARIDQGPEHVEVRWRDARGEEHAERADAVLLATGRRAAVDGLGLAAAGVDLDERGFVAVDERLRTSAPGVYALGDVNGGPQHTYISLDDARIVADQLWGSGRRSREDREAVPSVLFVDPPLARVGITAAEARKRGLDALAAVKPVAGIAAMPRPKIEGDARGLVSFVVDARDDRVLGASLLHLGSDEVVNLVATAMRHGITATQLREAIYTHPSAAEALNEVLAELRPL